MNSDIDTNIVQLNGRLVDLSSIRTELGKAKTEFEKGVLTLINDWLEGREIFELQTSGSTGTPKRIRVSREQMIHSATLTKDAFDLRANDTALLCIDPGFVGGKMMIVRSLITPMNLIANEPSANPLEQLSEVRCVNFAAFIPYQIQNILVSKHPQLLNKIEKLIIGGGPLDESSEKQLDRFDTACYLTYGMTETLSHIAYRKVNGSGKQPYFTALPGVEVSQDGRNCLIIHAPFLKDPVITNDLVEILSSRDFKILGRWDNVINSGGIKIIPERLEAAIEEFLLGAGIHIKFFIHGLPDPLLGQKVVIVVEAHSHTVDNFINSFRELRHALDKYQSPKAIIVVDKIIETGSGKINRLQSLKTINRVIEASALR